MMIKNLNIDLPKNFYDEEIRCGYKISSEMKKVWAVLLDLLNEFERICKKHGITWYADGGTILGAVRHKGFIPWDDDIDIMLLRKDYDKFCDIAEKEFTHPYFFQTDITDPTSMRGHVQIRNSETTGILKGEEDLNIAFNQGIFLDIFPIDDIPDDDDLFEDQKNKVEEYKRKANELNYVANKYRFLPNFYSLKLLPKHILTKILKKQKDYIFYRDKFEKECVRFKGVKSKRVCKFVLPPIKKRRIWKREWFNDIVYLDFEMRKVPVPLGYIELLDQFYGDWKTFKVGTATHGGCVLDPNLSYKDYITTHKRKTFLELLFERIHKTI